MALLLPACSVAEGDSLRPSARLVAEGEARQDRAKQNSRPAQQNHRANRPNETGDAKNRNAGAERPASGRGSLARVARVVDGDTIEVILRGRTLDVRLIGIDTPETVHPSMPVECFGPAASRFTSSRLSGEDVRLEFDIERTDRYGRTLAYVWKDGSLFNRTLVMRGLATVSTYPPNDRYESRFIAAENRASGAERGLWGSCDAVDSASNDGSSPAPPTNKNGNCTSGYSPCLPPAPDYDCAGGEGDGPKYASGPIRVTG
ncbi:MAG: thermonuclease family protein, partial [Actinomycetota bacterium]